MIGNDEIVDEVRQVRDEHAKKFNYDISAICADIRQKQAASTYQIVTATAKEVEVKDKAAETRQAA